MKNISDSYSKNKEDLIKELKKDLSPKKVEEKIINFFNEYYKLFKKDSNINEIRKTGFVIDIIKSSISTILSVNNVKLYLSKEEQPQKKGNKIIYSLISLIISILLARQLIIFFLEGFSRPLKFNLITPIIYFLILIYIHIYDKVIKQL